MEESVGPQQARLTKQAQLELRPDGQEDTDQQPTSSIGISFFFFFFFFISANKSPSSAAGLSSSTGVVTPELPWIGVDASAGAAMGSGAAATGSGVATTGSGSRSSTTTCFFFFFFIPANRSTSGSATGVCQRGLRGSNGRLTDCWRLLWSRFLLGLDWASNVSCVQFRCM